jgi:predicted nucleic acid-binding Zn ribbon protein
MKSEFQCSECGTRVAGVVKGAGDAKTVICVQCFTRKRLHLTACI